MIHLPFQIMFLYKTHRYSNKLYTVTIHIQDFSVLNYRMDIKNPLFQTILFIKYFITECLEIKQFYLKMSSVSWTRWNIYRNCLYAPYSTYTVGIAEQEYNPIFFKYVFMKIETSLFFMMDSILLSTKYYGIDKLSIESKNKSVFHNKSIKFVNFSDNFFQNDFPFKSFLRILFIALRPDNNH